MYTLLKKKMEPSDLTQETLIKTINKLNVEYAKLKKSYKQLEEKQIKSNKELEQTLNIVKIISRNFAKQDELDLNSLIRDLSLHCTKFKNKIHMLKQQVDVLIRNLIKLLQEKLRDHPQHQQELLLIINDIRRIDSLVYAINKYKKEHKKGSVDEIRKLKFEVRKLKGKYYERIINRILKLIESLDGKKQIVKKTKEIEMSTTELTELKKKRIAMFELLKQMILNELQKSMYKKQFYILTI